MQASILDPSFQTSVSPSVSAERRTAIDIDVLDERTAASTLLWLLSAAIGAGLGYLILLAVAPLGIVAIGVGFLVGFLAPICATVALVAWRRRVRTKRGDFGRVSLRRGTLEIRSREGTVAFALDSSLSAETVCSRSTMRGAYYVGPVTTLRQGSNVASIQSKLVGGAQGGVHSDYAKMLGWRVIDDEPERPGIAVAIHPADHVELDAWLRGAR